MPKPKTSIASLVLEIAPNGDEAPREAHLLPPGPFRAVDGRPADCEAWQLDATIAAAVIKRAAAQQTDIVIDFDHQSLRAATNGQRAAAAGWIPRTLEWRDGKGLYATGITWVGDTAALIAERKYRYVSAVFLYDVESGDVVEILSVALTNTPALDGLDAMADLARKHSVFLTDEEADMADEKQVAALTVERDGLKTQVAVLTTERDGLKTQLAALAADRDSLTSKIAAHERERSAAMLAADQAKHAELLAAALKDGRLTPAQKAWAGKQSLAALTEYLDATDPVAALKRQADGKQDGGHGLTTEELAMCSKMGVSPEDFIKARGNK